ncbi:FtsW/RodA/SpoVE family cell cycle protein [Actinoplanes sp. NPDC049681]|uniref:FtsW/RodA/SpoVE family cell cycle protein n=1 Tax=Actinoplanes sp. NPDC049681 TaxID=3363905 RepID=UPI00378D5294
MVNGETPTGGRHFLARQSLGRQILPILRRVVERPLTSYYLLLASAGVLLLISSVVGDTSGDGWKYKFLAIPGLLGFWIGQRLSERTLRTIGPLVLGAAFVSLALLDLILALAALGMISSPKLGPFEAKSVALYIGPTAIQPSELVKLGLALWGANVVAQKGASLRYWRELSMPLFPVIGLCFVLVGYNDLGSMAVLLVLVVGLLWTAGVRLRVFGAMGVLGMAGVGLLIAAASRGTATDSVPESNPQLEELASFFGRPEDCTAQSCGQLAAARSAMSDGGWFGHALDDRSAGVIDASAAHFVFVKVAGHLGAVGCVVVLALFALLAYTGFRIARRVDHSFRRLCAASITTWLLTQAVINIGGVVGLLPFADQPLPFVSGNGSELVVTLTAIGILAAIARSEPEAARALNAHPPAPWVRLVWAPLPQLSRRVNGRIGDAS